MKKKNSQKKIQSANISLIIQARVGSKRLPNKVLKPLAGKPMIFRILERVIRCKNVDQFILAIPNTKENQKLKRLNFNKKIKFYEGSENNLVERYYYAAKKFKTDIIVRIPADNCTPEPKEIDKIIDFYKKYKKPFFASNLSTILNNGYPNGIGAEVFAFSFLEDLLKRKLTKEQKEHPHTNFFDYKKNLPRDSNWCKVRTIPCPQKFRRPDIRLDVNTYDEYKFIKKIYDNLYFKKNNFNIVDIIKFLNKGES